MPKRILRCAIAATGGNLNSRPAFTAQWLQGARRALRTLSTGLLCLAAGAGVNAQAQSFPSRPVVMVVPFAAGGPTDVVARMLAVPMGKSLGQTVVVENTVGAGGTLVRHQGLDMQGLFDLRAAVERARVGRNQLQPIEDAHSIERGEHAQATPHVGVGNGVVVPVEAGIVEVEKRWNIIVLKTNFD